MFVHQKDMCITCLRLQEHHLRFKVNIQWGIVSIEVVFDARVVSNNFAKWCCV